MTNGFYLKKVTEQLDTLHQDIEGINKEMAPLQRKLDRLYSKREKLIELKDKLDVDEVEDKDLDDQIKYHLVYTHSQSTHRYKATQKFFRSLGVYSHGYFPHTMQTGIQISIKRDDEKKVVEQIRDTLLKVIKHVKPLGDGYKHIDIMEHTLSEYGVYELVFDNMWRILKTTYSRPEIRKSFKTLDEALSYIQEHHYSE